MTMAMPDRRRMGIAVIAAALVLVSCLLQTAHAARTHGVFKRRMRPANGTDVWGGTRVLAQHSLGAPQRKKPQDWDGKLDPPEYCFTSPAGNPAKPARAPKKGSPIPEDRARQVLALAAKDRECIILSRKCANDSSIKHTGQRRLPYFHRFFEESSKLTEEEKILRFPDLKPGSWGTCAIVGNGDNMLHGRYGKEIDEHDFVARYNVITKPYANAVGTKVSGMFDKFNYRIGPHKPDRMPTDFHMYPKRPPRDLDPTKMKGRVPPLLYGSGLPHWRRSAQQIYHIFTKVKKPKKKDVHPTGGFARTMSMVEMVSLGVCSRLDIYGFSTGGGKYFKRKHTVKTDHIIVAEHFTYRLLMVSGVKGKICLYGE